MPSQATPALADPALERLSHDLGAEVAGLAADPVSVMGRIRDRLRAAAGTGLFDAWRGQDIVANSKAAVLGGEAGSGTWKVQIFRVAEGRSHPPHCHENLASCLVLLDGRLHVREYERLRGREGGEATTLRRAAEVELRPGEAILTAEDYRNAHWFGAVGGPALAVNFKASGHFRRELLRLRNRRYLDPSADTGGLFRAPFISADEAKARFAARAL